MDQMKVGKFIAELRKERNLTQVQLAEALGVTDRAVSKWENGRGLPDYEFLKPLCEQLGISLNEFFAGERISEENRETRSEETLWDFYKVSRKAQKQNSLFKRALLIAGTILLLVVSAFAVDLNRMAHGRPVVFSNWGLNYMPEADLEEVELEKAIRDYVLCEQDRVIEYRKEAMERQNQSFDDPKGFVEMHIFQIDKLDQEYIVYSQVLEEVYYLENGKITCECGSNIPTVYRLCRNSNGQFEVISSKQPEDGERYAESLKEMFPRSVMRKFKSFNNKAKDAEMIFRMKQQVQEYYRGRGSN